MREREDESRTYTFRLGSEGRKGKEEKKKNLEKKKQSEKGSFFILLFFYSFPNRFFPFFPIAYFIVKRIKE